MRPRQPARRGVQHRQAREAERDRQHDQHVDAEKARRTAKGRAAAAATASSTESHIGRVSAARSGDGRHAAPKRARTPCARMALLAVIIIHDAAIGAGDRPSARMTGQRLAARPALVDKAVDRRRQGRRAATPRCRSGRRETARRRRVPRDQARSTTRSAAPADTIRAHRSARRAPAAPGAPARRTGSA